ncbi:hypothetical protein GCM10009569_04240 [Arthrobacter russicus]
MVAAYIGSISSKDRLVTVLCGGVWSSADGKFCVADGVAELVALLGGTVEAAPPLDALLPQELNTKTAATAAASSVALPKIEFCTVFPHQSFDAVPERPVTLAQPANRTNGSACGRFVTRQKPGARGAAQDAGRSGPVPIGSAASVALKISGSK